jgi:hypothetical protein
MQKILLPAPKEKLFALLRKSHSPLFAPGISLAFTVSRGAKEGQFFDQLPAK